MNHTDRSTSYSPTKVAKIIITCGFLCNICRKNGTPILGSISAAEPLNNVAGEDQAQSSTTRALRPQQRLVDMQQHVDT